VVRETDILWRLRNDSLQNSLTAEAAVEIEHLREGYRRRTEELMEMMAERDALLAEKGIVHTGSDAT
jgi:hypothetical protein